MIGRREREIEGALVHNKVLALQVEMHKQKIVDISAITKTNIEGNFEAIISFKWEGEQIF